MFCYICKNHGGFDYFETNVDPWAKFERNRFFDPKRTGLSKLLFREDHKNNTEPNKARWFVARFFPPGSAGA